MENYKFLSWLRYGFGRAIVEKENYGQVTTGIDERPEVEYEITLQAGSSHNFSKKITMVGPGDVKGIDSKSIVRKMPKPDTFDFEANYLPFIEFYDEDFLWRYTPASPDSAVDNGSRLRPWLALIVLKEGEFTIEQTKKGIAYIKLTTSAIPDNIFPPKEQLWAWAHVHEDIGSNTNQTTQNKFTNNTDLLYSRLLCPRKLERSTTYTAFLIPSFETGRLAGLGKTDLLATVKAQKCSWDGTELEFPFYANWRFGTSNLGDFEYLVRILKPVEIPAEDGARKMDISDVGYGVEEFEDMTIGLEGALSPQEFEAENWMSTHANKVAFRSQLTKILNLNNDINEGNNYNDVNGSLHNIGDHPFYSEKIVNDPIITPPLYGKWHRLKNKIDTAGTYSWFKELNLDPKYRAAAGLGTKVVQENQERYMEIVWKQVGEVNEANRQIREAQFAANVNKSLYESKVKNLKEEKLLQISAPAIDKMVLDSSVQPSLGEISILGEVDLSVMPNSLLNSGFRKTLRQGNSMLKNSVLDTSLITQNVVNKFNVELTVNSTNSTSLVYQVAPIYEAPLTSISLPSLPPGTGSASGNAVAGYNTVVSAQTSITNFNFFNQKNEPVELTDVEQAVSTELASMDYISKKLTSRVNLLDENDSIWDIKPIMKYPIIKDPLYNELKKLSLNYIIPNIEKIGENTISILKPNKKFIESFMVGANHEMSRELLWREYPTDQRGSYFSQFWDKNDAINTPDADKIDITPIHTWMTKNLGENHHIPNGAEVGMVLVIRGDLFRKFPNTIVYAQKAKSPIAKEQDATTNKWKIKNRPRELDLAESSHVFPILKAELSSDIHIVGFPKLNLNDGSAGFTKNEFTVLTNYEIDENTGAIVSGKDNPGWFFVFRERPGQIRFGIDDAASTPTNHTLTHWDELTWEHLTSNFEVPKIINLDATVLNQTVTSYKANTNSATMAKTLLQKPFIVAIHADEMLNN
jgi:hypothetical protein